MQMGSRAEPLRWQGTPVGFQIHGVRVQLIKDFVGTIQRLAKIGYISVELCSFKGYAGDVQRGDFGPLADMQPAQIRRLIEDAGMSVSGCHFRLAELKNREIGRTLDWSMGVGANYVILAEDPDMSMAEWRCAFELMNQCGEQVRKAGLTFALHTPFGIWKKLDGVMVLDEMMRSVRPENLIYQLDLSTAWLNGIDSAKYLAGHPGRFFSVHLRDGKRPEQPVTSMSSLPLGEGEINLKEVLSSAENTGVENCVVEMEVDSRTDPIEAFRASAEYLRRLSS